MNYPTNQKHFDHFRLMFKKWATKMGLVSYWLEYDHLCFSDCPDFELDPAALACVCVDTEAMNATAMLNQTSMDLKPTMRLMEICAFHEAREVFYYTVRQLLMEHYAKKKVNSIIHAMIQSDTHLLLTP